MTPLRILAVNVGSSSLRLDVWEMPEEQRLVLLKAEGVGSARGVISINGETGTEVTLPQHTDALDALMTRMPDAAHVDLAGHRLVHGGIAYKGPVWIDPGVLQDLDAVSSLVPLHLPPALSVVRHLMDRLPAIPQAAVFDTAFHATLPARAYLYAVPVTWRENGIRRHGFHGLACADVVSQLGPRLRERAVLLHLGAGCSATALVRGRSIDTSMGMTPMEGLVMATRSGDIDPGILFYLQREHGLSPQQLDHVLNYESGLRGLSGLSGDMKTLLQNADRPEVELAIDVFCYRAAKAAGAMAVALGGCDQIIFSGGIGEHAALVRARIIRRLEFLGARMNEQANQAHAPVFSRVDSPVSLHIVQIDEGRQVARETARLAGAAAPPRGEPSS